MKRATLLAVLLATRAAAAPGHSVVGSKHDLSVSGPGPIKATKEANPCLFCHTLHGGGEKGSSRPRSSAKYQAYESSTFRGRVGAPTGASRVCLSCHDGTIAVGQTSARTIAMGGTPDGRIPPTRRSNLGTDLRQSHPISTEAKASPRTRAPAHAGVRLDPQGLVQCTSCHDPHAEYAGSPEGKFLTAPTKRAELCVSCHPAVLASSHLTSTRTYAAAEPGDPAYASVSEAGCMGCHRPHGATPNGRLLRAAATDLDEVVCLRCHDSGKPYGLGMDVRRQLQKPSSHEVPSGGRHDAAEGPGNARHPLPEKQVGSSRHATCADCHNPHEATHRPTAGRRISGALDGVWGIDERGNRVEVAEFEWQICLKCHGDSANQPTGNRTGPTAVRRGLEVNLRRVFAATAASSHPVLGPGRNPFVPSLKPPLTTASQILCSDCHSSDDGPATGGQAAGGPHGSIYRPLLERNYAIADFTPESPTAYALCYKCHDRTVLLSAQSSFNLHQRHVVADHAPCSVCHTAHGVAATLGSAQTNAHLVDFDLRAVKPLPGIPPYTASGGGRGSCTLVCHGRRHDATRY
ncbi:MAG TPA: cytochrome c3 family protein [Anaeromyxobacter sp.]